jgi:hypothetical protein
MDEQLMKSLVELIDETIAEVEELKKSERFAASGIKMDGVDGIKMAGQKDANGGMDKSDDDDADDKDGEEEDKEDEDKDDKKPPFMKKGEGENFQILVNLTMKMKMTKKMKTIWKKAKAKIVKLIQTAESILLSLWPILKAL